MRHQRERACEQAGFTLIELLVAMAAGSIVIAAVVTILITTLSQAATMTNRVASTRATRDALAQVENELHSACVGTGSAAELAPIQPGSTSTTLSFLSYTGPSIISSLGPSPDAQPTWHVLRVANGVLTDSSYAVTGSDGDWTPDRNPTSVQTLLSKVVPDNGTPYFQYFGYKTYPIAGNNSEVYWAVPDGVNMLPDGTTTSSLPDDTTGPDGLSDADANATVEVLISLEGGATSADTSSTMDPETDVISLRLSEPPNEAPATSVGSYGPCE